MKKGLKGKIENFQCDIIIYYNNWRLMYEKLITSTELLPLPTPDEQS